MHCHALPFSFWIRKYSPPPLSLSHSLSPVKGKRGDGKSSRLTSSSHAEPLTMSNGDQPRSRPDASTYSLSSLTDCNLSRFSRYLIYSVRGFLFVSYITHLADVGREATGLLYWVYGVLPRFRRAHFPSTKNLSLQGSRTNNNIHSSIYLSVGSH